MQRTQRASFVAIRAWYRVKNSGVYVIYIYPPKKHDEVIKVDIFLVMIISQAFFYTPYIDMIRDIFKVYDTSRFIM